MWTTLNFENRYKKAGNICKGAPDIEFEQDWLVGLGVTLRDRQKIKNYFSSFKDFSGKADSIILLGFECTINTQNLNKIVGAIFEKIEILIFFLMWTTLNFGSNSKTERTVRKYLQEDPRYRMWTRLASWFRRYVRRRTEI